MRKVITTPKSKIIIKTMHGDADHKRTIVIIAHYDNVTSLKKTLAHVIETMIEKR